MNRLAGAIALASGTFGLLLMQVDHYDEGWFALLLLCLLQTGGGLYYFFKRNAD